MLLGAAKALAQGDTAEHPEEHPQASTEWNDLLQSETLLLRQAQRLQREHEELLLLDRSRRCHQRDSSMHSSSQPRCSEFLRHEACPLPEVVLQTSPHGPFDGKVVVLEIWFHGTHHCCDRCQ